MDFAVHRKANGRVFSQEPQSAQAEDVQTIELRHMRTASGKSLAATVFHSRPVSGDRDTRRGHMKYTKFAVKLSRIGAPCAEYVQRIDRKPIQTTRERNLALLMGKIAAMEVLESLEKTRWSAEMVAVQVNG